MAQQQPGVISISGALAGTEGVIVDNGGPVFTKATTQQIANLGSSGGTTTASLIGTETLGVQVGGTQYAPTVNVLNQFAGNSFTTSAQTNSTSVTLSTVFTALTYTQTSTGNTVHLKAAPVDGEKQGFSVTNIVTNLTVSAAANTVSGGAIGAAALGQAFWWRYDSSGTTWYRY